MTEHSTPTSNEPPESFTDARRPATTVAGQAVNVGHPGYGSSLVDDEAAFRAAHVLAKALHDQFCGCATYCERPQPDLNWHDHARRFVGVVLTALDEFYAENHEADNPQGVWCCDERRPRRQAALRFTNVDSIARPR